MILGGDEMGRTQGGNNNAYCQDNEISWFDWDKVDAGPAGVHHGPDHAPAREPGAAPGLVPPGAGGRQRRHCPGAPRPTPRNSADEDWQHADARSITFVLEHDGADAFALLLNAAENGVEFTVPEAPKKEWELALSTDPDQQVKPPVTSLIVRDRSITVLRSRS